ncbi:Rne/Rng family ribonuclease [Jiella sp. M17.18]|uniref:Rne/Rng family ribonuclease n=1 Tax=Jiella sp. M17.18 TaxID=3234247 RepID=UPI0034DE63F0
MANKMLIDASHPEETRVVVVRGSRIEEFDFESEHKKQLKGNIYLAKVTRVEPSLQAAFVEYGGNRHGFLAFSEIHPDYYQIPKADREALLAEELARAEDEDEDEPRPNRSQRPRRPAKAAERRERDSISEAAGDDEDASADAGAQDSLSDGETPSAEAASSEDHAPASDGGIQSVGDASTGATEDQPRDAVEARGVGAPDESSDSDDREGETSHDDSDDGAGEDSDDEREDEGSTAENEREGNGERRSRGRRNRRARGRLRSEDDDAGNDENGDESEEIDEIGSEDAMEEVPVRQSRPRKQYKIQEVIKRRQIILVQVVKEERGNKGAALTTYLSLAGRYSVLMPNTARGGGISRKITSAADRKRLKDVVRDLEVPRGMGIILRTAGANRTKAEVKRDYEYLMRLWETVRNVTLSSIAPALVYEEGSLIKRSIRDLYNKDIDQILVAGESGYREAKDFMRMLMPSQAKVVQPYRDPTPIFARQGIEGQLDKMLQPHVTLKSGGYIIINQTEALVAIDVNSGRSTREHSIEDTAFQTNLEAAEEVARQLRLRDLAGLIVIDFIDMEEKRNNRAVEKKMKDCLKNDRARIQVGKISHFGLLEMSRQRIRASVLESTMQTCPVCEGAGHIRSSSSLALHVLRTIEEHLQKHATHDLIVKVPTATALYVLNEKRKRIDELEHHYGLRIIIEADESAGHQSISIERGAEALKPVLPNDVVHLESVAAMDEADAAADEAAEAMAEAGVAVPAEDETREDDRSEGGKRRKRRRRRRRNDNGDDSDMDANAASGAQDDDDEDDSSDAGSDSEEERGSSRDDQDGRSRKRRRRGRRGGRRHRENDEGQQPHGGDEDSGDAVAAVADTSAEAAVQTFSGETVVVAPSQTDADAASSAPAEADAAPSFEPAASADGPQIAVTGEEPAPEAVAVAAASPVAQQPAEALSPALSEDDAPLAEASSSSAEPEDAPQPAANDDVPAETQPAAPKEPVVTSNVADVEGESAEKPRRTGWWARRNFF